mgnify:CR=1 FL=1
MQTPHIELQALVSFSHEMLSSEVANYLTYEDQCELEMLCSMLTDGDIATIDFVHSFNKLLSDCSARDNKKATPQLTHLVGEGALLHFSPRRVKRS